MLIRQRHNDLLKIHVCLLRQRTERRESKQTGVFQFGAMFARCRWWKNNELRLTLQR